MMRQLLEVFPLSVYAAISIFIFLSIFVGVLIWIFGLESKESMQTKAQIPFQDGLESGENHYVR